MKKLLLIFVLLLMVNSVLPQQSKRVFQTHNAELTVYAIRNNKGYEWKNDNIIVSLNYKTGQFLAKFTNNDFVRPGETIVSVNDSVDVNRVFELSGNFPVEEIVHQSSQEQQYNVELSFKNIENAEVYSILFKMKVIRPNKSSGGNYRIFILEGDLDTEEIKLSALKNFDKDVHLRLQFSGFIMG